MKRSSDIRRVFLPAFGVLATAVFLIGADEPKQTIDAKGLTFEAPKAWKSSPPTSDDATGRVEGRADRGRRLPGRADRLCLPRRSRFGRSQPEAVAEAVQGRRRQSTQDREQEGQAKNVEVTRAETSGHYYPASFPGRPKEPDRPGARLLGVDRHGREEQLLHPDGRPRQDDEEARRPTSTRCQDDQAGRELTREEQTREINSRTGRVGLAGRSSSRRGVRTGTTVLQGSLEP